MAGKELLFLRSTGTQYIDIGYVPNEQTRVVCRAIVPNTSGTNWLFGARQSASANLFTFAFSTSGYFVAGYGAESQKFDKAYNTEKEITVVMGAESGAEAGNPSCRLTTEHGTAAAFFEGDEFTCPCSLTLFAGNTNGNITCGRVTILCYDIYEGESLVMSLIPWKHADGRVGMLDKLTGTFYPNAGEGEFEYEEKPEQGGDISYIEFIANPKYRQLVPFDDITGWKLYNSIFGGAATQTVTFEQKRFADEPDGIFPLAENTAMWSASNFAPTVYDLLSASCTIQTSGESEYGWFEVLDVMDVGVYAKIVNTERDFSNLFGYVCIAFAPVPGVIEKEGIYFTYHYPLTDEVRKILAASGTSVTITFPAL